MKSTGIVRRIDELGRIVLPVELRKSLDIDSGDSLEIFTQDDQIILRKHEPSCVFCGGTVNMTSYHDKLVCGQCIDALFEKKN